MHVPTRNTHARTSVQRGPHQTPTTHNFALACARLHARRSRSNNSSRSSSRTSLMLCCYTRLCKAFLYCGQSVQHIRTQYETSSWVCSAVGNAQKVHNIEHDPAIDVNKLCIYRENWQFHNWAGTERLWGGEDLGNLAIAWMNYGDVEHVYFRRL